MFPSSPSSSFKVPSPCATPSASENHQISPPQVPPGINISFNTDSKITTTIPRNYQRQDIISQTAAPLNFLSARVSSQNEIIKPVSVALKRLTEEDVNRLCSSPQPPHDIPIPMEEEAGETQYTQPATAETRLVRREHQASYHIHYNKVIHNKGGPIENPETTAVYNFYKSEAKKYIQERSNYESALSEYKTKLQNKEPATKPVKPKRFTIEEFCRNQNVPRSTLENRIANDPDAPSLQRKTTELTEADFNVYEDSNIGIAGMVELINQDPMRHTNRTHFNDSYNKWKKSQLQNRQ